MNTKPVNKTLNSLLLATAALIWGVAFVAQTTGGRAIGPMTFGCLRWPIGAAVLLPVMRFLDGRERRKSLDVEKKAAGTASSEKWNFFGDLGPAEKKDFLKASVLCGIFLSVVSVSQQMGMYLGTGTGKAGFITACYIIFVPLFGIFAGKKCGRAIWAAIVVAVVGLYLLCMTGASRLQLSDVLVMFAAIACAFQILVVDRYAPTVGSLRLSLGQYIVAGLINLPIMLIFEVFGGEGPAAWLSHFTSADAWIALLYVGIMSSGVAYTLQAVGQVGVNPAVASLIMSLESVFSVLAGWVLLGQRLSAKELFGCVLIFGAIVLAQMPEKERENV